MDHAEDQRPRFRLTFRPPCSKQSSVKILILEHETESPAGFLGGWARRRGHSLETLDVPALTAWPDPSECDAIVSLGSDCSAHASGEAWVRREVAFLRESHQVEVPILGICFGGQALALALDGTVRRAHSLEVGWTVMDSYAPDLVPRGPWFRWHEDVFSVPPGGREIARSHAGPMAFASGLSVGLQFHPEVDSSVIRGWVDGARQRIFDLSIDAHSLLADPAAVEDAAKARAEDLFDRVARYWHERSRRSSATPRPHSRPSPEDDR